MAKHPKVLITPIDNQSRERNQEIRKLRLLNLQGLVIKTLSKI